MSGMHGVSGSNNMAGNCEMQEMHGKNSSNETKKKPKEEQISTPVKMRDNLRGKIVDIQI